MRRVLIALACLAALLSCYALWLLTARAMGLTFE